MKKIKTASYNKISQRRREWNDASGSFVVPFAQTEGDLSDAINAKLPAESRNQYDIEIHFTSKGYDDPGSMYGGSDHMGWAPEGEDDRHITSIDIITPSQVFQVPKTDPVYNVIAATFEKDIQTAPLEEGPEEPDVPGY